LLPDLAAALEAGAGPPLQRLVVGVEPIPEPLLARLMRARPGLRIFNGYGPTETTICATLYAVTPAAARDDMTPLGSPVDGMQVYVLDARLEPVPVGVPGEIYIGGVGVARGYVQQPALTAERFLPNPYGPAGSRLYRTGDRARYRADGNLVFLGRQDQQVKLRGYRIELGEIAAVVQQHPAVREAVVVRHAPTPETARLVAYVVPDAPPEPSTNEGTADARRAGLSASALRAFLQRQLPEYMVPGEFVLLDALPKTPNGKIDRQALPLPSAAVRPVTAYAAPQTEIELLLARIWQEALGVDRVGVHDNFFELGGHSLLMAQVHDKLQQSLEIELPLTALFKYPTIEHLAQYLSQEQREPASFQRSVSRAALRKEARRQRRPSRVQTQIPQSDDDI
jgi:acyl carrier protein